MTAPPLDVDVVVLGGGLTGVVAAYHLAAAGASVALVERGAIGEAGCSARSAGVVPTGLGDHASRAARGIGAAAAADLWRFSAANGRLIWDLVTRHDLVCGYGRPGSWHVAASEPERRDIEESAALLAAERVDCSAALVDAAALARAPHAPRGLAAIRYEGDAVLDAPAFLRGLAAAIPGRGTRAHVLERAPATAIEVSGRGVAVETAAGEVRAEIAIVAANAWASEVHPAFDGLVFPVRGQGLRTAPLPARVLDAPVSTLWGHLLFRQREDGCLIAAGFRPGTTEEEMGTDETPTDVFQGFLEKLARERIPGLPDDLRVEERWAGICGFAHDGLPLVGAVPGQPKLIAACGFTMRGLAFGAAAGKAAARLAVDGVREAPACLAPGRFL